MPMTGPRRRIGNFSVLIAKKATGLGRFLVTAAEAGVPEHVAHGAGHGAWVLVDGGVAGVEQPELRRSAGLLLVQILPVGSAPGRREDQLPLP
jgi:hypothetical protein